MTRKQRRGAMIIGGLALLGLAAALALSAINDSIVFFLSPSDVAAKPMQAGKRFRLGGLVAEGSVERGPGTTVYFTVTDTRKAVRVTYEGLLPDLFREGQGVVSEGAFDASGTFVADSVLAKHDETYMPPEVAEALKKQGVWRGAAAQPPPKIP